MKQKLVLSPNTFLWLVDCDVLLYGSHNQQYIKIEDASHEVCDLCKTLLSNRLYYVAFEADNMSLSSKAFLKQIEEKSLGRIVDESSNLISICPILSIQDNVKRIKESPNYDYRLLDYLHSVEFYVGGNRTPRYFDGQIVAPANSMENLSPYDIEEFLTKCQLSTLLKISIFLSNNDSKFIESLTGVFNKWGQQITIHTFFQEEEDYFYLVNKLNDRNIRQRIIIDTGSLNTSSISRILSMAKDNLLSLDFIVKSQEEVDLIEKIEKTITNDTSVTCSPVSYNNDDFIAKNVQLSETEILESKIPKRTIFIHQSININYWGKLSIRPDKTVSVDLFSRPIGHVADSIYKLILAALSDDMWLMTRSSGECRECLFRWLCPSPSMGESFFPNQKICSFK